jgi:predicted ATPase/transcriptional regulator with XRE-family HTH domain
MDHLINSPVFFGEWVKRRRKALDLTQEELANRASCSKHAVRKIESGERRPSRQLAGLLAQALDIPPDERQEFVRVARGERQLEKLPTPALESSFPTLQNLKDISSQSRIPLQPRALIGREAELSAMEKLFDDPQCRLLTLTGMGGIGKTSLAIEYAIKHQSSFSAGVFYVPLASIKSAEAVVPAIAEVLGFVLSGPNEPKEQLISYIASELKLPVLLVLDNLEHLLNPPAFESKTNISNLVSEFLQRLPNIKILVTSREYLNLRGEWTYEIHGLSIPPLEFEGNLGDYSASALFVQNARRVKMDFEVGGDERLALIRICQLLDGIPLAIELAAAWVSMLPCEEIALEIESNIDFLSTTMRDIPERHRSIRASFDHSWRLLSDAERHALSNLSIFQGQFDRTSAKKIAGADLQLLASLVSKSLVQRKDNDNYDLHEAIRQYAMTRLDEDPSQCFEVCELHCEHYLNTLASNEKSLKSAAQEEALRELLISLDNIRAAWRWAIKQKKYALIGKSLRSIGWLFELTGLLNEGIKQFEPLIQILKEEPANNQVSRALGLALMNQGLLYFRKGQFIHAQELYEESISVLRSIDERYLLADALIFLGVLLHLYGDFTRSRAKIEEGLEYARTNNDRWFMAYGIYNLGYIESLLGDYKKGYEQMLDALDMWRTLGDPYSISLGLNFLIPTLIQLKRYDEAKALMHESITLCETTKNRWGLGTAYRYLGLATLADGNPAEAQVLLNKSLDIFGEYVEGWDIALSLAYLGNALRTEGNLDEARSIYRKALRISIDAQSIPIAMESLLGLSCLELQKGNSEYSLEISYWVMHHPFITQEVRERAIDMNSEAQKLLKAPQIQEIKKIAQSRTMEDIAALFNVKT